MKLESSEIKLPCPRAETRMYTARNFWFIYCRGIGYIFGPFAIYECRRIEKFGISSDSCSEDRQFKSVSCNYYPLLRGNLERKVCIVIKTITKEGIQSLIDKKILKPYSGGYMNSRGYHVGYYKTCGNKRYIEDWYADKAEKLK